MSLIHYKGIVWEVNGVKDGKGILTYGDCSIAWNAEAGCFMFYQGETLLLARELRSELVKEATDCLLDAYASQFVPSWETDGTSQASPT
jgi:hypothetical protein